MTKETTVILKEARAICRWCGDNGIKPNGMGCLHCLPENSKLQRVGSVKPMPPGSNAVMKEHIQAQMTNALVKAAHEYAGCESMRQVFGRIIDEHFQMETDWRNWQEKV